MRLSRLFELSFVGALMFTPAMAEEIEEVHEKALRVLREQQSGQPPSSPATTPPPSVANPGVPSRHDAESFRRFQEQNARARAEREAQLKQGVAEAERIREQKQEQKRRETEQYIRQREDLLQRQREYDQNVARQAGAVRPAGLADSSEDVHSKALRVLRGEAEPSASPATPSTLDTSTAPESTQTDIITRQRNAASGRGLESSVVTESEVAPRVVAPAGETVESNQEKALQILRQQGTSPDQPRGPQPTPETRERVRQILESPDNPSPSVGSNRPSASNTPPDDSYTRELEQRALQMTRQTGITAPSTATSVPPSSIRTTDIPAAAQAPVASSPEDVHAKALEVLRQQNVTITDSKLPAPSSQPAASALGSETQNIIQRQDQELAAQREVPPRSTQPVTAAPHTSAMSQDAEAQAREILRQKQAAAVQQTPSSAANSVTSTQSGTAATPAGETVEYSRELEERARQILQERGQSQQSATTTGTGPAARPATIEPVQTAPTQPAVAAPTQPGQQQQPDPTASAPAASGRSDAETAAIHERAYDALRRAESEAAVEGIVSSPKTKRQKLHDLTELYKADKLTPAEYHSRRARILAED